MMVPGETLQEFAVQRRIFAIFHRRSIVSATSGRFIAVSRNLIAGYNPVDIRWQDIKQARIKVGIFGSTLTISALRSPDLAIMGSHEDFQFTGLRKVQAQAVYRICQAQEQAWREKRRLREIEELRAKAGGFQMSSTATGTDIDTASGLTARLAQAKEMLEQGLISDSEYETIKARIISSI
ncbi:SHOCT domain-containing protein [Robbsia andropogonis]|nr:SHOCT domain-containing protein [Robbsia andropogonis]